MKRRRFVAGQGRRRKTLVQVQTLRCETRFVVETLERRSLQPCENAIRGYFSLFNFNYSS